MAGEHVFHCGLQPTKKRRKKEREYELELRGAAKNITLDVDDITDAIGRALPARCRDLIEIAAYVVAADQVVRRGSDTGHDLGRNWRRPFAFRVAVRDLAFWSDPTTKTTLAEALSFVSEDSYEFDFYALAAPPLESTFLQLQTPADQYRVDRVLAFSGGLDSFAGAVESVFERNEQVALVTHRSSTKLDPIQRHLAQWLREALLSRHKRNTAHHFSIGLTRNTALDNERTQRTRSFFFAAIGGVVANELEAKSLSFFENGIVSMNLPITAQLIGTRATRTTHPKTLLLYQRLLSLVFDRQFRVENPFIWKTKADVVRIVIDNDCGSAIVSTVSCGSVATMTTDVKHCGRCSQCIDRRFGVLAAGGGAFEPPDGYAVELFRGVRSDKVEQTVVESYVRHAREVLQMDSRAFFARSGETSRILGALPGTKDDSGKLVFGLVRRHATEVMATLDQAIREAAPLISAGTVERHSLLGMVLGSSEGATRSVSQQTTPSARHKTKGQDPSDLVRVLHISDTHFAAKRWGQDHVLVKLAADVRRQRERDGRAPDMIVWTGDIADRGAATEYKRAEEWLREQLLPAADLQSDRVVLAPGNHDVNRGKITQTVRALHERMLNERDAEVVAAVLGDEQERAPLFASHEAFIAFSRRVEAHRGPADTPWLKTSLTIRGHDVHVASLCSSLVAYDSQRDEGRLVVGRYQSMEVLPLERTGSLVLAAVHHPWSYLAPFERQGVAEEVRRRCHVVLRGHLHEVDAAVHQQPNAGTIELAAGATYASTEYPNSYQFLEWSPSKRRLRVYLREWDRIDWIAHRNAFGGAAPGGYFDLTLAAEPDHARKKPRGG